MSARAALQAAILARLTATPGLAGFALFDAPPVRAALPMLVIEEPQLADWSTKSWSGLEARVTLTLTDAAEVPARLRDAAAAAEAALASLAGDIGGWRVTTVRLVRARLLRAGAGRWTATAEFAVRLYAP